MTSEIDTPIKLTPGSKLEEIWKDAGIETEYFNDEDREAAKRGARYRAGLVEDTTDRDISAVEEAFQNLLSSSEDN